jgi:hypothetical protein
LRNHTIYRYRNKIPFGATGFFAAPS